MVSLIDNIAYTIKCYIIAFITKFVYSVPFVDDSVALRWGAIALQGSFNLVGW